MATENLNEKIHDDLYEALRTVESYDLADQPNAAERLDSIAEMASALSSELDALCGADNAAQPDLFEGGAA